VDTPTTSEWDTIKAAAFQVMQQAYQGYAVVFSEKSGTPTTLSKSRQFVDVISARLNLIIPVLSLPLSLQDGIDIEGLRRAAEEDAWGPCGH
jgi:hypothetical protein